MPQRKLFRLAFPWLLLFGAGLVMYLRAPSFFGHPRIWAEEGTVYLAFAYSHRFWQALVAPHQGYYSLYANLAALAALQVGVLNAPLVTTIIAFAAQLVPITLVAWGNASTWDAWYKRLLGVLAILFAASSGEVWLNTINSQFFWSVSAFLILLEDGQSAGAWRRTLYAAILAISVLSGAVTSFLLSAFILKFAWQRNRSAALHLGILGLGSLVQAAAWWVSRGTGVTLISRLGGLDLAVLAVVVFNRTMIAPLLGQTLAGLSGSWFTALAESNRLGFQALAFGLIAVMGGLLVILLWRSPRLRLPLVLGYLGVVTLSVVTALVPPNTSKLVLVNPGAAIRYFYGPSVMFLLLLVANVELSAAHIRHAISWAALAVLLIGLGTGAAHYLPDIEQFRGLNWPDWRWQVARWQANPAYEIQIWPPPWRMKLQKAIP